MIKGLTRRLNSFVSIITRRARNTIMAKGLPWISQRRSNGTKKLEKGVMSMLSFDWVGCIKMEKGLSKIMRRL